MLTYEEGDAIRATLQAWFAVHNPNELRRVFMEELDHHKQMLFLKRYHADTPDNKFTEQLKSEGKWTA